MDEKEIKEINEKMANFIGLKKIINAKTIIGDKTYVSKEVWVHRFDPIQDNQVIYNDNYPQKELVPAEDVVSELTFHKGGDSLMEVYDHCQKLLVGFIKNGKLTEEYLAGSNIIGRIFSYMFDTTHTYKIISEFIDWYNSNKEKFALLK